MIDKMDKAMLGQYGVYQVAAMLLREGYTAVTTSRNTKAVDIIAFNAKTGESAGIQVKTVRQKGEKDINEVWLPAFSTVPSQQGFDLPSVKYPYCLCLCTGR